MKTSLSPRKVDRFARVGAALLAVFVGTVAASAQQLKVDINNSGFRVCRTPRTTSCLWHAFSLTGW